MRLVNFHADTPYRVSREALPFDSPYLMAGSRAHLPFDSPTEIYAIWSDSRRTDAEAWSDFFRILADFRRAISRASLPVPRYRLALEDARILAADPGRLDILAASGVSVLIPFWKGVNALGGAHDTECGLTPFGREIIRRCFLCGIVPDISHASMQSADDILTLAEKAGRPVIASHSCFYSLCAHSRNIRDEAARRVADLGGIVGISFAPEHLAPGSSVGIADVLRHVMHGLALIPNAIALGTDYDGIECTPIGLPDTSALPILAERLSESGIPDDTVEALFYRNGARFVERYLPPSPALN